MSRKPDKHLLIFEPGPLRGHTSCYLRNITDYWRRFRPNLKLTIAAQSDLLESLEKIDTLGLQVLEVGSLDVGADRVSFSQLLSGGRLARSPLHHLWEMMLEKATQCKATELFVPRIDGFLPLMASGATTDGRPISGLVLDSSEFRNKKSAPQWSFIFGRVCQLDWVTRLFLLDPVALKVATNRFGSKFHYLTDPIVRPTVEQEQLECLRRRHNLAESRKVLLLFGDLTTRKGVIPLMEALQKVPAEAAKKITILMVGRLDSDEERRLRPMLGAFQEEKPGLLSLRKGYIPEKEVSAYFALSDAVLMPYQEHAGMSGVLLHAAAANRPVFATDFGLIGELVRQYELGVVIGPNLVDDLGRAMTEFAVSPRTLHNSAKAAQLVAQHHPDRFAETILDLEKPLV